jgi:hypothetical protein
MAHVTTGTLDRSDYDSTEDAAFDYAANLRQRGFIDVDVYRYDAPLDNREAHYRNHETAFGYAVRYTSGPDVDDLKDKRTGERFHERSMTVFVNHGGLPKERLLDNGGVLADIAGEGVTPYWVGWWCPEKNPDTPGAQYVGMKIFGQRISGDSYPWQLGPQRMYHLIMTKVEQRRPQRGPEPAGDH